MRGLDESTHFFQESLELRQVTGDHMGELMTVSNFGINLFLTGSLLEAEAEFMVMEKLNAEIGQPPGIVAAFLGWIAALKGDMMLAHKFSEEAQQVANDTQFRPNVSHSLSLQAVIECLREHYEASLQSGLRAREIIALSYYIFFAD